MSVRRFHDVGRTMLIPLIMLISMLLRGLIVLLETISNVYLSDFYSDVSLMIATVVVLVISIVLLIVSIFALIYCVTDSEKGTNEYGTNPKSNVMLRGSIINWTDDKIHQSNFYVLNRKRRNYLYNY